MSRRISGARYLSESPRTATAKCPFQLRVRDPSVRLVAGIRRLGSAVLIQRAQTRPSGLALDPALGLVDPDPVEPGEEAPLSLERADAAPRPWAEPRPFVTTEPLRLGQARTEPTSGARLLDTPRALDLLWLQRIHGARCRCSMRPALSERPGPAPSRSCAWDARRPRVRWVRRCGRALGKGCRARPRGRRGGAARRR